MADRIIIDQNSTATTCYELICGNFHSYFLSFKTVLPAIKTYGAPFVRELLLVGRVMVSYITIGVVFINQAHVAYLPGSCTE